MTKKKDDLTSLSKLMKQQPLSPIQVETVSNVPAIGDDNPFTFQIPKDALTKELSEQQTDKPALALSSESDFEITPESNSPSDSSIVGESSSGIFAESLSESSGDPFGEPQIDTVNHVSLDQVTLDQAPSDPDSLDQAPLGHVSLDQVTLDQGSIDHVSFDSQNPSSIENFPVIPAAEFPVERQAPTPSIQSSKIIPASTIESLANPSPAKPAAVFTNSTIKPKINAPVADTESLQSPSIFEKKLTTGKVKFSHKSDLKKEVKSHDTNTSHLGDVNTPAERPFTLIATGFFNMAARIRIKSWLMTRVPWINEDLIDLQLDSGKLKISRLGPQAAIHLFHFLKEDAESISVSENDATTDVNTAANTDEGLMVQVPVKASRRIELSEIPISSLQISDFPFDATHDLSVFEPFVASLILDIQFDLSNIEKGKASATTQISDGKLSDAIEKLKSELRLKAHSIGANALIEFSIETKRLTIPTRINIMAMAVAIHLDDFRKLHELRQKPSI